MTVASGENDGSKIRSKDRSNKSYELNESEEKKKKELVETLSARLDRSTSIDDGNCL